MSLTRKIANFNQPVSVNSGYKFVMYNPNEPDLAKQDNVVDWNLVQALLTAGLQVTILNISNNVQNLTNQLANKVDTSAVGDTVAPAVNGIVPPENLPFSLSSLVGVWEASTNTPTLANGIGTEKTAYIATDAGSVNFGAGSISFVAGNIVIYLGGVWNKVGSTVVLGVTDIVTEAGSQVGTVPLDTSVIAPTLDRRYISDDTQDAIAAATGTLSTSNPVVSRQELNNAILGNVTVVRNPLNMIATYERDGIESGNGTTGADTLTTLGYNDLSAATRWPRTAAEYGTIPSGSTLYDEICAYEALLTSYQQGIPSLYWGGKEYNVTLPFGDGLPIPKSIGIQNTGPLRFTMDGMGTTVRLRASGAGKSMFLRDVADQTEASAYAPWSVDIKNFTLQGDGNTTLKGMRLCAMKHSSVDNCKFRNMGTGLEIRFGLSTTIGHCWFFSCNQRSVYLGQGDWTGGTSANSTTQAVCRNIYITVPLGARGMEIVNTDNVDIDYGVFEGAVTAASGIYYSNQGTTVCKDLRIGNLHIEQPYSDAFLDLNCQDVGHVLMTNCFQQNVVWLVRLNNISGTNRVILKQISKANGFKFRNMGGNGGAWSFEDIIINGNPTSAADVVDTATYPLIWDGTGSYTVPLVGRIKINPITQ